MVVRDQDHSWGRGYYERAMTIGLIIHGDSAWTGHGPGVMDLLTCRTPAIVPVPDPDANIAWRMDLRPQLAAPVEEECRPVSSYALYG